MTAVNGNVQTLMAQAAQAQQTLAALTGGQGVAPGTAAVTGTQPGLASTTAGGQNDPTAPIRGQNITIQAVSIHNRPITIVKTDDKYELKPPTGFDEAIILDGKPLRFDSKGVHVRNFEISDRKATPVELDRRQGIAAGIGNLSRVIAGRQERLKELSESLAKDANELGSTNQVDIQKLVMEQQATEHLSNMNHKIYESVQNAISPWLR